MAIVVWCPVLLALCRGSQPAPLPMASNLYFPSRVDGMESWVGQVDGIALGCPQATLDEYMVDVEVDNMVLSRKADQWSYPANIGNLVEVRPCEGPRGPCGRGVFAKQRILLSEFGFRRDFRELHRHAHPPVVVSQAASLTACCCCAGVGVLMP